MTHLEKITALAQSIYLAKNNRYFDDIEGEDGQIYIAQTVDWTNQFIDELELEADWNYAREAGVSLGTISSLSQTFSLDDDIRKLITDENRYLDILQDGTPVSTWSVVSPNLITSSTDYSTQERVTVVGGNIVFSRALKDTELGGTIVADVINYLPRLAMNDTDILDLIKPKQLLILGVAKNATLPDIVQGGISPSLAQKYNDLLEKAVAENNASSLAAEAQRQDFGYIGGVGF